MRPIQEKLNLDSVTAGKSYILQQCIKCSKEIPLNELLLHSLACRSSAATSSKSKKTTISDASGESDNEPSEKRKKKDVLIHYDTDHNFDSDTDGSDLPKAPLKSSEIPDDTIFCSVCEKSIETFRINEHFDSCLSLKEKNTLPGGSKHKS